MLTLSVAGQNRAGPWASVPATAHRSPASSLGADQGWPWSAASRLNHLLTSGPMVASSTGSVRLPPREASATEL